MFCTNCGSQVPDNSTFCINCGASMTPSQPLNNQSQFKTQGANSGPNTQGLGGSNFGNQSFGGQSISNQNFGGPFSGQPNMGAPYNKPKSKTPVLIGVSVAGVALIALLIFGALKLFGGSGGTYSSPENVVKAMFKAVSNKDLTTFRDVMYLEDSEMKKQLDNYFTEEMIAEMNAEMVKQYGSNWYSLFKVGTVTNSGNSYKVSVSIKDDKETIYVVKVGSKYYISAMDFVGK